jgi:hypothetical protein
VRFQSVIVRMADDLGASSKHCAVDDALSLSTKHWGERTSIAGAQVAILVVRLGSQISTPTLH